MLKPILTRIPAVSRLMAERDSALQAVAEYRRQMQFKPGHFYSPVSSATDISQRFQKLQSQNAADLPGINLNLETQLQWCQRIAAYYPEQPFAADRQSGTRYYFDNPTFTCSDALFLYGMLRVLKPARIVEIGSGFSSAVMLDTSERFCDSRIEMTFVEPYPERLHQLLTDQDRSHCRIVEKRIQDVTDAPWSDLKSGDILFIDSSHVSKCGSDVNQLFFDVLPSLAPGVVVHVHDVFPHFEYPESWHRKGRSWNEDYLLRAFLQFNDSFQIMVWVPFMVESHPEFFAAHMPTCQVNSGGSFWMQRAR